MEAMWRYPYSLKSSEGKRIGVVISPMEDEQAVARRFVSAVCDISRLVKDKESVCQKLFGR